MTFPFKRSTALKWAFWIVFVAFLASASFVFTNEASSQESTTHRDSPLLSTRSYPWNRVSLNGPTELRLLGTGYTNYHVLLQQRHTSTCYGQDPLLLASLYYANTPLLRDFLGRTDAWGRAHPALDLSVLGPDRYKLFGYRFTAWAVLWKGDHRAVTNRLDLRVWH